MASKTISLSLDAYKRLKAARRHPGESFSSVVRRACWDETLPIDDGQEILAYYEKIESAGADPYLDDEVLDRMDERVSRERTLRASSEWQE